MGRGNRVARTTRPDPLTEGKDARCLLRVGEGSGAGYLEIGGAQDPDDPAGEGRVVLRVSRERADRLLKHYPIKFFQLRTVRDVVRRPERIYWGLRDEDSEDRHGWCYVGFPTRVADGPSSSYLLPRERAFLVFVDRRKRIYDWRLERTDPEDPRAPEGASLRFGGLAWPKRETN